jgi:PsbP-like protein
MMKLLLVTSLFYMQVSLVLIASAIFAMTNSHMLIAQTQDESRNVTNTSISESFVTYEDSKFGISIDYPSNWRLDNQTSSESIVEGMQNIEKENPDSLPISPSEFADVTSEMQIKIIAMFTGPPDADYAMSTEKQIIQLNTANIAKEYPISLDDFVNENVNYMKIKFPHFRLVESPQATSIDRNSALRFIYTYKSPLFEDELKEIQIITIKDEKIYGINFGSTTKTYSSYLPTFQAMVKSFKINN